MPEARPVVAERNDPKRVGWYSESESHRLAGKDPEYAYQWFSQDPRHPQFVGNYNREHETGNQAIGFCKVRAWEVVKKTDKDHNAGELRKRADDGKELDTTVTHGGLILCRLHRSEFAKYQEGDRKMDAARTRMLSTNNRSYGRGAALTGGVETGTLEDGAADADLGEIINRSKEIG